MTAGNTWRGSIAWLFFSTRGRIPRALWWGATACALGAFFALSVLLQRLLGVRAALVLYPPLYYALLALAIKRCHDYDRSGAHLLLGLVPLFGTLFIAVELGWKRGTAAENRFGSQPRYHGLDHLVVDTPATRPGGATIVNDVTQLNPIEVAAVVAPTSVEELQAALRASSAPLSIGGGHFSMGGQTASPGSVHIDMRRLNAIVWIRPLERRARVQAGLRFCDLQRALDPHDLAVKTMQTYANFTVGGALSVNAHGRYVGLGPIVLSVRAIELVLADGTRVSASPEQNAELFYGAIGGYGALGIIVECELDLAENVRVERFAAKVQRQAYLEHFKQRVRSEPAAIFHNADLYLPAAEWCRSVTWKQTDAFVTVPRRLMRVEPSHRIYRYLAWSLSELPFGAWRREHLIDPLLYAARAVHWRNYEAGYDVAELEPEARRHSTYVLQEYFVPIERFDEFVPKMTEIFSRHQVNVLNVSIRHALPDPGTLLAWATDEVFAFVVYYKQRTDAVSCAAVATWTRELIEAALSCGGRYYLPYQPHARPDQFRRAYPRAKELFALKRKLDPQYRLRNALWDRYYAPEHAQRHDDDADRGSGRTAADSPAAATPPAATAEARAVVSDEVYRDRLFLFLQNIFTLFPPERLHHLVCEAAREHARDEDVYRMVQARLDQVRSPVLRMVHGLRALAVQKAEMTDQTMSLLGDRSRIDGYLEIGSIGRYASALRSRIRFTGGLHVMNDLPPTMGPADIAERGQLAQLGTFHPLSYEPIAEAAIGSESLDMATCFIGLHHAPREKLAPFLASIARVLRPGGLLLVRDHDAGAPQMRTFVSFVHTVFNCGLGVPWHANERELRFFVGLDETIGAVEQHGFRVSNARLLQANDPTDNVLLAFEKGRA